MSKPLFSVIVPEHNSAEFMRKGLESIKAQTFTDYELIVVCDACEDNTAEIAREYTDKVFEIEERRCGMARNKGLDEAAGEWILFMDDDDWWLHEYVLQLLAERLTDQMDILCFSFIFRGLKYARPLDNCGHHYIACWCKCYRRPAIGSARFSAATDGTADVQFYSDMFSKGLRIWDWDMPMYYYNYLRPGSQTERNQR